MCHPPGSGPALEGTRGFARSTGPQSTSLPIAVNSPKPGGEAYPNFKDEETLRGGM